MYAREENRSPFELLREEFDVSIFYPASWRGEFGEIYDDSGFKAIRLPFPNSYFPMLGKLNDYDFVWIDEEPYYPQTGEILKHCSEVPVKVLRSAQNIAKKGFLRKRAYKRAGSQCTKLCAVGETSRIVLSDMAGRDDVRIVPLHVWDGFYKVRRESHSVPVIGFAGRLCTDKGADTFTDTIKAISFKCKVIIAGKGDLEHKIMETCSSNNIPFESRGVLTQTQMADFYKDVDVFLNLSRNTARWSEQQGRSVIEAAAAGCSVISTGAGELKHTMKGLGTVLENTEGSFIAGAIEKCLDSGYDENARRRAEEFSAASCSKMIMKVLTQ